MSFSAAVPCRWRYQWLTMISGESSTDPRTAYSAGRSGPLPGASLYSCSSVRRIPSYLSRYSSIPPPRLRIEPGRSTSRSPPEWVDACDRSIQPRPYRTNIQDSAECPVRSRSYRTQSASDAPLPTQAVPPAWKDRCSHISAGNNIVPPPSRSASLSRSRTGTCKCPCIWNYQTGRECPSDAPRSAV